MCNTVPVNCTYSETFSRKDLLRFMETTVTVLVVVFLVSNCIKLKDGGSGRIHLLPLIFSTYLVRSILSRCPLRMRKSNSVFFSWLNTYIDDYDFSTELYKENAISDSLHCIITFNSTFSVSKPSLGLVWERVGMLVGLLYYAALSQACIISSYDDDDGLVITRHSVLTLI